MKIKVELRSFISEEKYKELIAFFSENAKRISEDFQETYFFDSEQDLRIQRNSSSARIWLKRGQMHDEFREEFEIKFNREDFEELESLLFLLGYNIAIKWFRERMQFNWNGIIVSLDNTKGYGHIIELESETTEENKQEILKNLERKFAGLEIRPTTKEEFDKKFKYYKDNWKELTK